MAAVLARRDAVRGMSADSAFVALGEQRFVSLTTFRRSGQPVSTPVWVARDGDVLLVTTPAGTGKVKRLRHDHRVEFRPCGRTGSVAPGTPATPARATVDEDPAAHQRVAALMRRKYRLEYLIVMGLERIGRRGSAGRVVLRITAA